MAAGLGFKTFTTGEVLTAADTNGYLMQGVLVFASAAARDAAITSPQEGQFAYLKDTNVTTYYTGSAWANLDTTGMTNPMTTTGDMVYSSSGSTPARLGIGTTGQVLSVAGGIPSWASAASGSAYVAGKNFIINGGMDIWQRGTSIAFTSTRVYTTDRFQALQASGGNCTVSRQVTGDTTNLPNIQYAARVGRDNGTTQTGAVYFAQTIETINSIPLAGQTITVSFYARKGANFSATSDILNLVVATGTGTNENILAGFTGSATPISTTKTLTATWQKFSASATLAATTTEIGFYVYYNPTGTAGAADYLEITGVQLEEAASASDFSRAGGTIALELAACQRYYYRLGGATYASLGNAVMTSATIAQSYVGFPQLMRTSPTINTTGTAGDYRVAAASAFTCTSVPVLTDATFTSPSGCTVQYASSGMTGGSGAYVNLINNINAFLAFSAEI
jgi:hypothetical protein